jgi:hypothetical protein
LDGSGVLSRPHTLLLYAAVGLWHRRFCIGSRRTAVALQVAAVPHWFDEEILALLLDIPLVLEAQSLAAQLRRLSVVEPFPARGPGAANVHENARLALRRRMKSESPDWFAALSTRAQVYFEGKAPHLRIEALYHRFTTQPEAAEQECATLYHEWNSTGHYEELSALGVVLEELLATGLLTGIVRNSVLDQLANIRHNYQPRSVAADQTHEALAEAQRSGVLGRIAGDLTMLPESYHASLNAANLNLLSQKFGFLPSIEEQLKRGGPIKLLSFTVASWFRFLTGLDESGKKMPMLGPMAQTLRERARAAGGCATTSCHARSIQRRTGKFARLCKAGHRYVAELLRRGSQVDTCKEHCVAEDPVVDCR